MKHLLVALPALFSLALLTGCPQSRLPDTPPTVPQPKASSAGMAPYNFEI